MALVAAAGIGVALTADGGGSDQPTSATTTAPAPIQPLVGGTGPVFENCDQARAAGATPLRTGDPGYREGLDGDGDGLACE